jgi:coatomer protein complex subunit gamma
MVVQNVAIFNQKSINPIECIETLIDLTYLINQGHVFSPNEQETIFFSVTKLLNSQNEPLKRVVFLFLAHWNIDPNTGFILTGHLGSFIQGSNNMLKVNSFRLLGRVIDVNNISMLERYIKNCISGKQVDVSSSSILCTYDITLKGNQVAKSWIGEINDRLNSTLSDSNLLAFHTLLLLKEIKGSDKLYLLKTYLNICSSVKSQFANCQLIRYVGDLLIKGEVEDKKQQQQLLTFLENSCLRHHNDSIILEAVRVILKIPNCKEKMVLTALDTLKQLLSSFRKAVAYGALKTLDEIALKFSSIALDIFIDLEKILETSSNNISFKALALSIFLKVSKSLSESRLERMLKTITEQYTLFKEDFKKEIVFICKSISQTNPTKYFTYFNFFSNLVKLDAAESTKLEIINAIHWFIINVKEYRRMGLIALGEYIEDCKFETLKTKIILILGEESAGSTFVNQIVRYIYNRIILEGPVIRAASVSALGIIAKNLSEGNSIKEKENKKDNEKDIIMQKKILLLIKNCINDTDSEVRERAIFYYKGLNVENITESNQKKINNQEDNENLIQNNNQLNEESSICKRIEKLLYSKVKSVVGDKNASDIENIQSRATFIQELLKKRKEELKNSKNPLQDIKSALEKSDEVLKQITSESNSQSSISISSSNEKTDTKANVIPKSGLKLPANVDEEYLKTSFYKVYGAPIFGTALKVSEI